MPRIDAHQHFWQYNPVRDAWIGEDMALLRRDFLPQDLGPMLEEQAIDGCVVVQSDQSLEENSFQLDNALHHRFIKGVVGWVDLCAEDIEDRLAHYRGFPLLKGFRHILQGESQRDYMLRPDFCRGIGLLNRYGYTYDILVYPDQLSFARALAERFPHQPFVLDHMGKPDIKGHASGLRARSALSVWQQEIRALGACPNVWCKVSGMVTEADWTGWRPQDFLPFLDTVLEAFGPKRLMFGSDWPVCLVAGSYGDTMRLVNDYFAACTPSEKMAIFGDNAANFYHIIQ
jgi:L-fuconolactonase